MAVLNGLVPARFLTIIAHMVLVIVIFWSRDENVRACLPKSVDPNSDEYKDKDMQLIIGLSVSLGLFVLELVGFMGGLSMFLPSQGLISTAAHASASFALAFFVQESWECDKFWYIFGFCSCLPALVEIVILFSICCSTVTHASAAFTLVLFLFDQWCSDNFWYIFAFCSALPGIVEVAVIIGVVALGRGI